MNDFTDDELRIVHWAIQVATDALMSASEQGTLPKETATKLIYRFSDIEDKIVVALTSSEPKTDDS